MPREDAVVYRRRRAGAIAAILVAALLVVGIVLGLSGGSDPQATATGRTVTTTADGTRTTVAATKRQTLPDGTRSIFPEHRAVALYGNPQDDELGALGIGSPATAAKRLLSISKLYSRKTRPAMPVMELITSVAASAPGDDGKYRIQTPKRTIDRYLKAARAAKALLVLDIQPGLASFPAELKRLRPYLREPDVGLALDPEWHLQPGQVPGNVIGSVGALEVNAVSQVMAEYVRKYDLPEKLFVIHQFTDDMVRDKQQVKIRPGLATVFNVDGFGGPEIKKQKYAAFVKEAPRGSWDGFKLFFREDTDRLTPRQVMALQPRPAFVVYE